MPTLPPMLRAMLKIAEPSPASFAASVPVASAVMGTIVNGWPKARTMLATMN